MKNNVMAIVRQEEGYMRLTLEYTEPEFRTDICKRIVDIEKKFDIYPEVLHRRDNEKKSFSSIEFSGEDYTCNRTCGEFIETLMKKLDIKESIAD